MNKNFMAKVADMLNAEEEAADKEFVDKGTDNNAAGTEVKSGRAEAGEEDKMIDDPFKNEKKQKKTNSIEVRKKLVGAIVNTIAGIKYLGKNYHALQLYIVEPANVLVFSSILQDPDFEEELRLQMTNAQVSLGKNWQWQPVFKTEPPTTATRIGEGLFLALAGGPTAKNVLNGLKAKITAITGRLAQPEFVIEDTGKIYNIGRGANPKLNNGTVHQNQIVVAGEDFEGITPDDLRTNQYVSRAHACIICETGKGFSLKPLPGGTPLNENRTRILRGGFEPLDVSNPTISYPLQNGDKIELGKSVLLDFEIVS